ncbi:ATP-dependent carboxylate-amine ligase [Pseudovibrio exalbescens]|uniref:ATP-dependent carboxylate-amine ligase n=1 Tax=Pseudovibrio exalbescens TaxID=197461 RepID=UPI00236526FB|nr:ATP-dependent carboxylate-amine ligase [Pseudovibrio exalbescens]MDD7909464.1 ATP-dependent carboxylate-amine ligase [Pseudovibrio exalbescens]
MGEFVLATTLPSLSLGNAMLCEFCADHGAEVYVDPAFQHVGVIQCADGRPLPFKGTCLPLNSFGAARVATDKDFCSRLLAHAGVNTPKGLVIHADAEIDLVALRNPAAAAHMHGATSAMGFAETVGFPVFVKPNEGSQGIDVLRATTRSELQEAADHVLARYGSALLQQGIAGRDFRVIVLDGEVLAVIERRALSVTGDGTSSLAALIERQLTRSATRTGGRKLALDDPRLSKHLKETNLSLNTVPAAGDEVELLPNANLSTGGMALDRTEDVGDAVKQIATTATAALGLRYAGIDVLVTNENAIEGCCVLEVNAAPGLSNFYATSDANKKRVRRVYKRLVDAILA